jgi:hypothetical protein
MKKLMIAAALVMLSACNVAGADDFIHEQDKQKHMALSALGAHALHAAGLKPWQAFAVMMYIGTMKELRDHNSNVEHGRDMLANAIGASSVFVWTVKF